MLLILAGVALATLTGQGNIIGNAENAVGKYNNSVAGEQQLLNEIEKYFQNYLEGGNEGNPPTPPDPVEPPKVNKDGLATENVIIKPDANSDVQITIPAGFAPAILATGTTQSLPGQDGSVASIMPADEWNNITTEDINKGIVIVDNAITYDNGQLTGTTPDFNEYVWVPIPDFSNDFNVISEYKFLLAPIEHTVYGEDEKYTAHTYIEKAKVDANLLKMRFQVVHIRGMMQYLADNGVEMMYIKNSQIYKLNPLTKSTLS